MSEWWDPFGITGAIGDAFDPDLDEVMKYLEQAQREMHDIYDPYIQHGMNAYPGLNEQYNMLMTNPAAMQQMLGQGFEQSPGYQWNYDQNMNAANQAMAAGGMLGTNAHQQQAMSAANGLASQEYNNYYNRNANLYGMGLEGNQGFYNSGFNASNQLAGGLGNVRGSQANLTQAYQNRLSDMIGSILGGAGAMML